LLFAEADDLAMAKRGKTVLAATAPEAVKNLRLFIT
jgi:hypothetical protein